MKNLTRIITLAMALALSLSIQAQQWSDVGDPGFTPTNQTSTLIPYANRMAMYNNTAYMSYLSSTGSVQIMRNVSASWLALPDPSTGINCNNAHIAFDASGNLYLAYFDRFLAAVVKKYDGTTWSTIGGGSVVSGGSPQVQSLVINPVNNEPYIAIYFDTGTTRASVYRFNGTAWVLVGPANFSATTSSARLAISSSGTPYITIKEGYNGSTFSVLRFDGTNWVAVGPTGFGNLSTTALTHLAIDATGAPHVFSANATNNKANVLKYNGTAWVTVGQADFSAGAADHPFLRFDNSGVLHLAYQDAVSANGANKATVMKFNGTSWVGVGSTGLSGAGVYYPTLAFNSSNEPFIGFRDASTTGSKGTVMKLCNAYTANVTSTTPGTLCGTGAINLSASSSAGNLRWYNAPTNGQYLITGSILTTPVLTATTTYSVAAYDINGCSSPRTSVVATVNAIPSITTNTPGSRCGTGSVSLSATTSIGTIQWFASATGGSSLATGSSFNTPSISTTTTYFVEANNNGCLSTSRTSIVATVNTIPTLGVGLGAFRCGPGSLDISTSSFPSGSTVTWFAANTGGSSLATGNTFTTPSISNTITYYAEANFNGCVSASRQALVAEVRTVPTVTSSAGGEICNEGTVNLSATTSSGSQPRWYDVQTGGTSLSSSNSFTTPTINATKTYYIEALQNGCASTPRTAVIATIKPYPSLNVSDVSRCDAGTVSFEAASTGVVSWFATSTGGSSLGTGVNYTTPVISVTTPYFAQATLNGCITPARVQVQAIIVPTPTQPTITQNNANIEAPVLTSSATTGNQWYKNDVAITGATNATYTITDAGAYKVQVNNSGCLSPFSTLVNYVITGLELPSENMLTLYPNPVADELVINLNGFDVDKLVNVAIMDVMGRTLSQSSALGEEVIRVKVSGYHTGQYLVLAQQGNRRMVRSFIKLR